MLDEAVLEFTREKVRPIVRNGKPSEPTDNDLDGLREELRVRLAEGRLPPVAGVSQPRRGTSRPCIVCRCVIDPTEVEREVTGCSGVALTAHEACYKPWREESRVWRDLVAVGEAVDRRALPRVSARLITERGVERPVNVLP